jgi:hypothetical protein
MRNNNARAVSAICCALAIALFGGVRMLPRLNAETAEASQPVCSAAMFTGGYSYNVNGTIFSAGTLAGFYSVVGVLSADGIGSLSGTDAISQNGVVQSGRTYTGSYLVQPNCTGTVTLNYAGQTASFAIAVSNSGDQVSFLQTTNGTVGAGTAMRQFIAPGLLPERH